MPRQVRMLDGNLLPRSGYIEHVEYHGFCSSVLAAMYSVDHLHQCFALMEGAFGAVMAYDSQIALFYYAVIDYGMMMPSRGSARFEHQPPYYNFRLSCGVVWQSHAVPTL